MDTENEEVERKAKYGMKERRDENGKRQGDSRTGHGMKANKGQRKMKRERNGNGNRQGDSRKPDYGMKLNNGMSE